MRLRTVRRIWQAAFFILFLYLVVYTAAGAARVGALTLSASFFLEVDPLVAFGTILSTGELYHVGTWGLLWALVVLLSACIFGRAFCGWVCPFGTLHHLVGYLSRPKEEAQRQRRNRHLPAASLKYLFLVAFLCGALLGSLQVGLLDPLALCHRSFAVCLLPLVEGVFRSVAPGGASLIYSGEVPLFAFGWVVAAVVAALLIANVALPRFFCRVLCPLGAFLGILSRVSLFRVVRNEKSCRGCGACQAACEGSCDPQGKLRRSECVLCFNCLAVCPHGAFSYRCCPEERTEIAGPELSPRRAFLSACAGFAFTPFVRLSGETTKAFSPAAIRPPGARKELEFLSRCVKCGQCIRICPTGVLQPALFECGIEGLWTPVLRMRYGWCDIRCTLCTQVCPTGALLPLEVDQRNGLAPYPGHGQPKVVKLGTAFIDRGRCLPWGMARSCVACEEVCPVSPKAITGLAGMVTRSDGSKVSVRQPYVDPERCVGCGACEYVCPVRDRPAIRVSAIGENRSDRDRGFTAPR